MKKATAIFCVGRIKDLPNRNHYQRILTLASKFRLIVVTTDPLPSSLSDAVEETYICKGALGMCKRSLAIGKRLMADNRPFYIHTQYTPFPLMAGFLCKQKLKCPWVYDLWDHPSLTWSKDQGVRRWIKLLAWKILLKNMLKSASAWIVGMHPDILSHLPVPNSNCRIILHKPGVNVSPSIKGKDRQLSVYNDEIVICYVGHLITQRGVQLILDWARQYKGSKARLELMGPCDKRYEKLFKDMSARFNTTNTLSINLHGELPHTDALRIMETADIGICLTDPAILNYRYAYPVKIAEYLSQGLVTVASDGHGVRAMLQPGIDGFITNYDLHSFIKMMDEAISSCMDKDRKEVLVANAIKKAYIYEKNAVNSELLRKIDTVVGR